MKIEMEAAFLEMMADHVQMKTMPYMLSLVHSEDVKDRMEKVDHFVKWFIEECERDKHIKRRNGKSLDELRDDSLLV